VSGQVFSTVIEGGVVIDGLGGPSRQADVAIADGQVAAIGDLAGTARALTLDAAGCVVAPGFVDIHSHSDISLLADPRAESGLLQGVTTEVVGNCGHGPAPIADTDDFRSNLYGALPSLPIDWVDLASTWGCSCRTETSVLQRWVPAPGSPTQARDAPWSGSSRMR
jgi:N-acyl-D-amino-acid deacylase